MQHLICGCAVNSSTSFHTCSTGFVPPPFDFAETGSLRGHFFPNFLLFHAKIDCQFKATNHLARPVSNPEEKSSKHNLMLPKLLLFECCRRPLGCFSNQIFKFVCQFQLLNYVSNCRLFCHFMTFVGAVFPCVSYFLETFNVYLLTAIYDTELHHLPCKVIMAPVL